MTRAAMSGASWPILGNIVTFGGITPHGLKMHLGDFLPSVPGKISFDDQQRTDAIIQNAGVLINIVRPSRRQSLLYVAQLAKYFLERVSRLVVEFSRLSRESLETQERVTNRACTESATRCWREISEKPWFDG
jgi:hypothetical protein